MENDAIEPSFIYLSTCISKSLKIYEQLQTGEYLVEFFLSLIISLICVVTLSHF